MAKYHFLTKAVEDLTAIWHYTLDEWSEEQADKYYMQLIASCNDIAKDPYIGKPYNDILHNLFGYRSGGHIIFYKVIEDNEVEIIRILHGRMDLRRQFI